MNIDAKDIHYRDLNARIRQAVASGDNRFVLDHVYGQRYIGTGLGPGIDITINGVPGNDLAAFMNGAHVTVNGNGQDGVANTMNAGRIVIHGDAGEILGHSMRGGKVFVRGSVGYRTGIHMKAYQARFPMLVIGGTADDYLGEYMAGGVIIILGLDGGDASPVGDYVGTGMHGGAICVRGKVEPYQLGREVGVGELPESDWTFVAEVLGDIRMTMNLDGQEFRREDFLRLTPKSSRPYGMLYAY